MEPKRSLSNRIFDTQGSETIGITKQSSLFSTYIPKELLNVIFSCLDMQDQLCRTMWLNRTWRCCVSRSSFVQQVLWWRKMKQHGVTLIKECCAVKVPFQYVYPSSLLLAEGKIGFFACEQVAFKNLDEHTWERHQIDKALFPLKYLNSNKNIVFCKSKIGYRLVVLFANDPTKNFTLDTRLNTQKLRITSFSKQIREELFGCYPVNRDHIVTITVGGVIALWYFCQTPALASNDSNSKVIDVLRSRTHLLITCQDEKMNKVYSLLNLNKFKLIPLNQSFQGVEKILANSDYFFQRFAEKIVALKVDGVDAVDVAWIYQSNCQFSDVLVNNHVLVLCFSGEGSHVRGIAVHTGLPLWSFPMQFSFPAKALLYNDLFINFFKGQLKSVHAQFKKELPPLDLKELEDIDETAISDKGVLFVNTKSAPDNQWIYSLFQLGLPPIKKLSFSSVK